MTITIHKTAEVSINAKIGKGTKIWQNAQIADNSEIGENCVIGHNCAVFGAKIGDGVKLESNVDVWRGVVIGRFCLCWPFGSFYQRFESAGKISQKRFFAIWPVAFNFNLKRERLSAPMPQSFVGLSLANGPLLPLERLSRGKFPIMR